MTEENEVQLDSNLIEEIETRTKRLAESNLFLAQKLKENDDTINYLHDNMSRLSFVKQNLEKKEKIITELKTKTEAAFFEQRRLETENTRLITDLSELKKKSQDSINLMDEKTKQVTDMNLHVSELTVEIKKQKNEIARLQNQVELLTSKNQLKENTTHELQSALDLEKKKNEDIKAEFENKKIELTEKQKLFDEETETLKKNYESRLNRLVQQNTLKIVTFKSKIDKLHKLLQHKQESISERQKQASQVINEFNKKFKDLVSDEDALQLESYKEELEEKEEKFTEELNEHPYDSPNNNIGQINSSDLINEEVDGATAEEEEMIINPYQEINDPYSASPMPNIDDLIPMIKVALDHGDNVESIFNSLLNSGIDKQAIQLAFTRVNESE
ncbi:hypothetical protein HN587_06105 [Candidatus Woesearchaeota archaeon]|jgi:chromosome segregation ATPase|nr:hypothetical protein [Candidatus Woesearchaeota archaeon]